MWGHSTLHLKKKSLPLPWTFCRQNFAASSVKFDHWSWHMPTMPTTSGMWSERVLLCVHIRAGHFWYSFNFLQQEKIISCVFYQAKLTGSWLFK